MHKYIITSQHFTGEVEALYIDSTLSFIDFRQSSMPSAYIHSLLSKIAVDENNIGACFNPGTMEIVKGDVELTFDMFWNKYSKKVNKKRCQPLWNKLSKPKQVNAYLGIDKYNRHLARNGNTQYKLDPENYLRDERWEDEY